MLPIGTQIAIPISGMPEPTSASHEVIGHEGSYLVICPIDKLDVIVPGQRHVPVTRIHEFRVIEKPVLH